MTVAQVAKEKSYLNRPKAIGIKVRKPSFNPKNIPRHFFANSPVMSHLLTALSSTLPIGEQFFVHSVRNVRDKITDEKLQAQIAAFIGQEAMHSKAHADLFPAVSTLLNWYPYVPCIGTVQKEELSKKFS